MSTNYNLCKLKPFWEAFKNDQVIRLVQTLYPKSVPGYHFSCSQGAHSHLGRQGVCFPLTWFISNILELGLNEYGLEHFVCQFYTVCGVQSTISVWMLTGGSQFSLFITVNVVFTFIALFGGIILFALATDWFDVSGFISVFGTVWRIFFFF